MVAKFKQPDYTGGLTGQAQTGTEYPLAIDASMSVVSTLAKQLAFAPDISAPRVTYVAGGTLPARTYYVKFSYRSFTATDSMVSLEAVITVPANNLLKVLSPGFTFGFAAQYWRVYVGTTSNGETRQDTSDRLIGTDWIEPATGLISGTAMPADILQLYGEPMRWVTNSDTSTPKQNSTGDILITLTAAHATLDRYDRVVATINAGGAATILRVDGTPGSGVPPALTIGEIPLAYAKIPATSTKVLYSDIIDERPIYVTTQTKPFTFSAGILPTAINLADAGIVSGDFSAAISCAISNTTQGRSILRLVGTGVGGPWNITLTGLNNAPAMPLSLQVGKSTYLDISNLTVLSTVQNV